MKKIYLLFLLTTYMSFGQAVWFNEIHYDNAGADTGEGFEISGATGIDLSVYTVELYNGSDGSVYATISLSGILPDNGNGLGSIWFPYAGLQNGAPDGLAIVQGVTVVQFLSYEGALTATAGAANGMTATDIGVSETGSDPVGTSIQLQGTGNQYTDFTWATGLTATPGADNNGQVLPITKNNIERFELYPNPVSNGTFYIKTLSNEIKYVRIFNVLGKQVLTQTITNTQSQIDVSNLRRGVYILKLTEGNKVATRKVVIR